MILAALPFWILLHGDSMLPDYRPGRTYEVVSIDTVRRGDVVVFRSSRQVSMKRVAGVPGDTLTVLRLPLPSKGYGGAVIQDNRFYVVGDNWRRSRDSRHFGTIHRRDIRGIAKRR